MQVDGDKQRRTPIRQLLAKRSFLQWLAADAINTLGSGISSVVLPILVYDRTGSAAQTGVVFGLRVVPYLLLGLIAGPIADRFDRKRLLVLGLVGEGLAMATIPVANMFAPVSVLQIYAVTLAASVCFVFSDAATFGALPTITGATLLPAANGLLTSLGSAALIAGPAVGAVLTGWIGAAPTIWFDAASFALAAAALGGIPGSFRVATEARASTSIRRQAAEGLRFIATERAVLTLILVGFINSLAFGAVLGQIVVYADRALHLPRGNAKVGLLFTAGAVGTLLAGAVFARLFTIRRIRVITPTALAAAALIAVGLATTSAFVVAAGLYVLFSLAIQLVITVGITYRQLASPDHLVSSVNVVGRMVAWGGQPFGALLGGLAAEQFGIRSMTLLAAGCFGAASVYAFVGLRRTITPDPGGAVMRCGRPM